MTARLAEEISHLVDDAKLKVLLALDFLVMCFTFSLQLGIKADSLFTSYLSGTSTNGLVGLLDVSLTVGREPSVTNSQLTHLETHLQLTNSPKHCFSYWHMPFLKFMPFSGFSGFFRTFRLLTALLCESVVLVGHHLFRK